MVLLILDGWGVAAPHFGNAVSLARTPVMDRLQKEYAHTTLKAHGRAVGLPTGQPGNSEAGHINIGAGRVVEQEAVVILKSIENSTFFHNPAFLSAIEHAKEHKSALHVMGLFTGENSPHAYPDHMLALIALLKTKKVEKVFFHLFTDGRDASPYAALGLFQKHKKAFASAGKIATVMGRYWAMDRNKQWERTRRAYEAMVMGKGETREGVSEAIQHAYDSGDSDEFIEPTVITRKGKPVGKIGDNDAVIFMNLRSERARQIAKPFVLSDFEKLEESFKRKKKPKNVFFVALTDFGPDLGSIVTAYPSPDLKGTLTMALGLGRKQLYTSESEKYAHVTYFMNGGYKNPIANEKRERVLSAPIKNFKNMPRMHILRLTRFIQKNIETGGLSFLCANIPNGDMVGHTGDVGAAVKAVEAIDRAVGRILSTVRKKKGALVITADHGNVEEMVSVKSRELCTHHSTNPVPFIIVGDKYKGKRLRKGGSLRDVAPTILGMFGIRKPKEMTGKPLLSLKSKK